MRLLALLAGVAIILVILWDGFEAVVLPRRGGGRGRRLPAGPRRETYLSYYGPLLLIVLLATWAAGLVFGFALVHWGLGSQLSDPEWPGSFATDLYISGPAFFTLGLGDGGPRSWAPRLVPVPHGGTGVGVPGRARRRP